MQGVTSVLSADITRWAEECTGAKIIEARQVPAGSRLGYAVDVKTSDGAVHELFLQQGRPGRGAAFNAFDREADVYRALERIGVPIPHVWGVDVGRDAFLVDRVHGRTWLQAPRDPGEQVAVAQDFMQHLARWHSADASQLGLDAFGPVRAAGDHQRDHLQGLRTELEAAHAVEPVDLLARASIDWLEKHVPAYDGPAVLVQGDTGPGNFMYEDGKVTAVLDWELAHFGDPMDDIAWLSWRTVQHGFPDFPGRLREYERLSGIEVDDARVIYYRLNACARLGPRFGIAAMGDSEWHRAMYALSGGPAESDRAADGSGLIFAVLHRRMRLAATAAAFGVELPARDVATGGEANDHAFLYAAVLDQLRDVVTRSQDRTAANLAKAVAREVKFLGQADRYGAEFARQETDDLTRLLAAAPASVADGRRALAAAAREGRVSLEDYLLYQWQRVIRDDFLMREASGAVYERSWPALR